MHLVILRITLDGPGWALIGAALGGGGVALAKVTRRARTGRKGDSSDPVPPVDPLD